MEGQSWWAKSSTFDHHMFYVYFTSRKINIRHTQTGSYSVYTGYIKILACPFIFQIFQHREIARPNLSNDLDSP